MSISVDPRWFSSAEMTFLVKLTLWLSAIWLGLMVHSRWSSSAKQRFLKLSLLMFGAAIVIHWGSVAGRFGYSVGLPDWISASRFDLRFSSLESPDRVPPSVGYFQRWEEGSVWRDRIGTPWNPGQLLLWLSSIGICWYGIRLIGGVFELDRRLSRCRRASASQERTLLALATKMECRRTPQLWLEKGKVSPFCCGLIQPVIVVGRDLLETIHEKELEAILAHELAHIQADDLWWREGLRFLQAVFWYHPMAWPLSKRYEIHAEALSDRAAVSCTQDAPTYARLLARVALEGRQRPQPHGGFAMARIARVRRRIEDLRVISLPESRWALRWQWGLLLCGLILMGVTSSWGTNRVTVDDQVRWRLNQSLATEMDVSRSTWNGGSDSEMRVTLAQLISQLSAKDWRARQSAAILISQVGSAGRGAHDALVAVLSDPEWQVRQSAAYALLSVGVRRTAMPALITCLEDREWHVRKPAVLALGQCAEGDPQILDSILPLLADPEWHVRLAVVSICDRMPSLSADTLSALATLESDREPRVRRAGLRLSQKYFQLQPLRG